MARPASHYFEEDAFFNPQLQLDNDFLKKSKVETLLSIFRLTITDVEHLRSLIRRELQYGLEETPPRPSVIPVCNTFVTKFFNGTEVGDFLGMEIGSTNLRLVHLKLRKSAKGKYENKAEVELYEMPEDVRESKSIKFFGFLASSVKNFVVKRNLATLGKDIPLGLTLSFGCDQLAIDRGNFAKAGLNTNVRDAVGKDPVQLLQNFLVSQEVPVKVVALTNDATATLVYGKYLDKDTSVGLILGSGSNVAYIEEVSRFGPISDAVQTFGENVDRFIVNAKYCVMGDKGEVEWLRSKYDQLVDNNSFLPKVYVYEKLVGGAFICETFRYMLLHLARNGLLFCGHVTERLASRGTVFTADISNIESEFLQNNGNARTNKHVTILLTRLGYMFSDITEDDCSIVTFVGQLVTTRSALLVATAVSVFVDHLAHLKEVKIACDGLLFEKHPKMSRLINGYLSALSKTPAKVFSVQQASSVGAAYLAAVVSNTDK